MTENRFMKWMKQEVEPYLRVYRKNGYMQSEDGKEIFYASYRLPEGKAAIVISHGFCEFAEKYNEVIYRFLQAGYSVYILEHRGHGYSYRETDDLEKVYVRDYQEYVRDFALFVKRIVAPKEKHRILFAHSMGGAIGVLTLEQYPTLFQSAVISAPMLRMKLFGEKQGRLLQGTIMEKLVQALVIGGCIFGKGKEYAPGQAGFLQEKDFSGSSCQSEERYNYIFQKRIENPKYQTFGGTYKWVEASIRATEKLRKRSNLAKIEVPILLFVAEQDHMVDNSIMGRFQNNTLDTKMMVMTDAKHEIFNANNEARTAYYREIFDFIKQESGENARERENEKTGKILGYV